MRSVYYGVRTESLNLIPGNFIFKGLMNILELELMGTYCGIWTEYSC